METCFHILKTPETCEDGKLSWQPVTCDNYFLTGDNFQANEMFVVRIWSLLPGTPAWRTSHGTLLSFTFEPQPFYRRRFYIPCVHLQGCNKGLEGKVGAIRLGTHASTIFTQRHGSWRREINGVGEGGDHQVWASGAWGQWVAGCLSMSLRRWLCACAADEMGQPVLLRGRLRGQWVGGRVE